MPVPRSLAPLRASSFRRYWTGQLASNLGDAVYAVALPWYVLATHGGALLLGIVLASYGAPRTALVLVGGRLSDRTRPWTVMMWADAVRAAAVGTLALMAATGRARAVLLVPVAIAIGAGEGLFLPASFAIVPSLVPDGILEAGNALSFGSSQLALLVGPALGGLVVGAYGASAGFAMDALSFGVSALTLATVRERMHAAPMSNTAHPPSSPTSTTAEGTTVESPWSLLRHERPLQVILLVTVVANLGAGAVSEVALPAFAHGPLHAGSAGYGELLSAFGLGALLGTLAAGTLRRASRPAIAASAFFFVEAGAVAAVPIVGGLAATAAVLALFGTSNAMGNLIALSAFQRWAPPHLLGRLMGGLLLASLGVFPLSVLLAGLLLGALQPGGIFAAAGALLALSLAAALTQQAWRDFGSSVPTALFDPHPPADGEPTGIQ
jgi:MFS family permease